MTTTTDILTRARALLDGITPGEWEYSECNMLWAGDKELMVGDGGCDAEPAREEDGIFIAAAPSLVRELCEEVEAAEKRATEVERQRDKLAQRLAERIEPCDNGDFETPRCKDDCCNGTALCWLEWAARKDGAA